MSKIPERIAEQNAVRISAVGVSANEHIANFQKALDYSYDLERHLTSLAEALGVRQFVASERAAPAGTEASEGIHE